MFVHSRSSDLQDIRHQAFELEIQFIAMHYVQDVQQTQEVYLIWMKP